jgi:hypothetical protein
MVVVKDTVSGPRRSVLITAEAITELVRKQLMQIVRYRAEVRWEATVKCCLAAVLLLSYNCVVAWCVGCAVIVTSQEPAVIG